jgi:acetyl-CoA carboxylase carboxyltransferase component
VGILANNGILFSESANKGAHFIQLCNQSGIPLLFLQNITGFMVGRQYEEGAIIKHGAKLVNAVSNSTTPAITVIIGASYGAGNYAMCGKAYQPRFLFSWPNARLAVMGPEQLAGVMDIIRREAAKKSGKPLDEAAAEAERQKIIAQIMSESDAWYCTGRVWDDGVIDPRQTRNVVGMCLSVLYRAGIEPGKHYGVFRM